MQRGLLQINDIDTVKKESNSAYELGLNYKYSDSGNVYVKYERGFRSPGATEMIDNLGGTVGYQLNNIKGEKYMRENKNKSDINAEIQRSGFMNFFSFPADSFVKLVTFSPNEYIIEESLLPSHLFFLNSLTNVCAESMTF